MSVTDSTTLLSHLHLMSQSCDLPVLIDGQLLNFTEF